MIAASDLVSLVSALAWPLVVLMGIVVLRRPLSSLFAEIGKRATKVSVFQFAVELSTITQVAPTWTVGTNDVRQLTRADVFDSATMSLFQELSSGGASDYIVVDLGSGQEWLSSRLYIFALVLQRMRSLRCIVFTARRHDESGIFVGLADPGHVRWCLAIAYPWLESAFARAYDEVAPEQPDGGTSFIKSIDGELEAWAANNLVRAFLTELQFPRAKPLQPGRVAPGLMPGPPEWVELPQPPPVVTSLWERANWIDVSNLERLLGRSFLDPDAAYVDSPDQSPEDRARAIARRSGSYVALVGASGRFRDLVDREALLEKIAGAYADRS